MRGPRCGIVTAGQDGWVQDLVQRDDGLNSPGGGKFCAFLHSIDNWRFSVFLTATLYVVSKKHESCSMLFEICISIFNNSYRKKHYIGRLIKIRLYYSNVYAIAYFGLGPYSLAPKSLSLTA